jgi:hypothetical protein
MLIHRWPTAMGTVVAASSTYGGQGGTEFAALTMLMPVVYLGAAVLDRRRFAWVLLLAGVVVLAIVPSASQVVPSAIFLGAALAFLVARVTREQRRTPGSLTLQTVGELAFGSVALAAIRGPGPGRLPRGFRPLRPRRMGRLPLP